jgi:hypothetical protein
VFGLLPAAVEEGFGIHLESRFARKPRAPDGTAPSPAKKMKVCEASANEAHANQNHGPTMAAKNQAVKAKVNKKRKCSPLHVMSVEIPLQESNVRG